MNQADVIAKLQAVFDTVFLEPVVLTPSISAKDVPEWDSLMHISLIVMVEKAFSVRFRVGEVEATRNVGEFADLILEENAGVLMQSGIFLDPTGGGVCIAYCWRSVVAGTDGQIWLPPREQVYSSALLGQPELFLICTIKSFEEKGDIDIAFMGSSRIWWGIDTPQIRRN